MSTACSGGGSACGCCAGVRTVTPAERYNRPGLPEIGYRAGTHGQFLSSMLARLSAHPALRDLTTREPNDPSIAFLDGWAVIADVLTFYTERVANEGYLRTATEPESLVELGRLVGYRPRPALGASGYLAYTLDPDARTTIPAGSQAKSVPSQGQLPQTFETSEDLIARQEWNELEVRRSIALAIDSQNPQNLARLELNGTAPTLRQGDRMVFVFDAETRPRARTVHQVEAQPERDRTVVRLITPDPPGEYTKAANALLDAIRSHLPIAFRSDLGRTAGELLTSLVSGSDASPPLDPADPKNGVTVLGETLPALREILAVAQARNVCELTDPGYVRPDLARIVGLAEVALRAASEATRTPATASARLAQASGCGCGSNGGSHASGTSNGDGGECRPRSLALEALYRMAPALARRPAKPPLRPRYLVQNARDVLGIESDAHPQLLMAARPRLAETLYTAWQNLEIAPPVPLSRLEAMRTKAHVFGASQRKSPGQGGGTSDGARVVPVVQLDLAYDDEAQLRTATVTYTAAGEPNATAVFELGDDPSARTVPLSDPENAWTPGEVSYRPSADQFGWPEHTFRLTGEQLPPLAYRFIRFGTTIEAEVRRGTTVKSLRASVPSDSSDRYEDHLGTGEIELDVADDLATATLKQAVVEADFRVPLDAVYGDIVPGTHVVVDRASWPDPLVTKVIAVNEVTDVAVPGTTTQAEVAAMVTQLTLADPWLVGPSDGIVAASKETTVYANGEAQTVAEEPITGDIADGKTVPIELARPYGGLRPGRWLVVSGERTDVPDTSGVPGAELVMLKELRQIGGEQPGEPVHSALYLSDALEYRYRRDTVKIYANVVAATQGETRTEPLGSGDASVPGQAFELRQAPLTYLPAVNPLGADAELTARVGGVRWHPTESLVWHGAIDRVYALRAESPPQPVAAQPVGPLRPPNVLPEPPPAAHTSLVFGDGVHGSRLPTGVENVTAEYRSGAGRSGNLAANQVNQLASRPLSVQAVTNPLPTTGGTDADGPDDARVVTPLRMLALDRVVSVSDYEDFTRARAGIGKASATRLFDGSREIVYVTIAAAGDVPLDESSAQLTALEQSLAELGDVGLPINVDVRERIVLVLSAGVKVLPDYTWDLVEPAVRSALAGALGFDRRELAQPAFLSEVIAAMQAVEGVEYVDVDVFDGLPEHLSPDELSDLVLGLAPPPRDGVPARAARFVEERAPVSWPRTLTSFADRHDLTLAEVLALNPGLSTVDLDDVDSLVVRRGVRPAQLAVLDPSIPETLTLRRIP